METVHRRAFHVHTYDTDFRGRALPVPILNFLQEAAGEHAALLGLSVTGLIKDGLTWVLSRYHLRLSRYPLLGETVEVATWPSGHDGFFWLRDFELRDRRGDCILVATSSWILLDTTTKKPSRDGRRIATDAIREVRALEDEFPKLPGCDAPERQLPFRVGLHDLDLNDHVNHAVYVRWALEAVPEDTLRAFQPLEIEVSYQAEAFFGDEILSRTRRTEERHGEREATFLHSIVHSASGRELTRLRTRWAPIGP